MFNSYKIFLAIPICFSLLTACAPEMSGNVDSEDNDGNTADIIFNVPNYTCDRTNKLFELPSSLNDPIIEDLTIGPGCYHSEDSVVIENGAQLTILPDTILKFKPKTGLIILDGNVLAIGSAQQPIYFTSDSANKFREEAWIGIEIRERSSKFRSNRFKFVLIEHAGNVAVNQFDPITTASIKFTDTKKYNTTPESKPRIFFTHNIIRDSIADYAFHASRSTFFNKIENNIFYNNDNYPISIDVNEAHKINKTNQFSYEGNRNNNNKLVVTGSDLNVSRYKESQYIIQNTDNENSTSITWDNIGIPYEVEEDIGVASTKLVIEAGVNILFNASSGFRIFGASTMTALGTDLLPINMSSLSLAEDGNWRGLSFSGTNGIENKLTFVNITNAGADPSQFSQLPKSGISLSLDSEVEIRNCTISNSAGYALFVDDTSVLIDFNDNKLTDSALGIVKISSLSAQYLLPNNIYGDSEVSSLINTITIVPGVMSTNELYKFFDLGIPYIFYSNFGIDGDVEIEAGTTLLFNTSRFTVVRNTGSLIAIGTVNEPILFSDLSQLDADTTARTYWDGLNFEGDNGVITNSLNYVTIDYAGEPRTSDFSAIQLLNGAKVKIDNSEVTNLSPNATSAIFQDATSVIINGGTNSF